MGDRRDPLDLGQAQEAEHLIQAQPRSNSHFFTDSFAELG
jgi:hypothetical protein